MLCNIHAKPHKCGTAKPKKQGDDRVIICKAYVNHSVERDGVRSCPCLINYEYLGYHGETDYPDWYKGMKFRNKFNYKRGPTAPKKYADGQCLICLENFDEKKLFKRDLHTYRCRDLPLTSALHQVCKTCYQDSIRVNPENKNKCPMRCEHQPIINLNNLI